MANKNSRSGGKYGGNHTTLIPAAALVCDIAHQCASVTRISPGFIKAGLRSVQGNRRVKITEQEGVLLLSVRDNVSHQEVRVYVDNPQRARDFIEQGARKAHLKVTVENTQS